MQHFFEVALEDERPLQLFVVLVGVKGDWPYLSSSNTHPQSFLY